MTKTELTNATNARLAQIETALAPLDDEQAVAMTTLFPVWASGVAYTANYRAQYAGATALEALFGWLYLTGQRARANELFRVIMEEEL